ncbi:MAG: hypothetical protein ACKOWO_01365 [Sediminibacterium sp.]
MTNKDTILNAISLLFGSLFTLIGLINTFWGNDPFYGLFVIALSLIFYPPAGELFTKLTGWGIKRWVKILVGFFIVWSAVGVGELFDKIDLMRASF